MDDMVMRFQLSRDCGMDWMWGDVGELLFWITREDLATQRFDEAVAHLES